MYRFALSLVAALFVAGPAHARDLVWPTICIPAHDGVPEQCALLSPTAPDYSIGVTLYDPTTGYRAAPEVAAADLALGDAQGVLGGGIGYLMEGSNPQNDWDRAHGIGPRQLNDILWVVASIGDRDPGPFAHVAFAPWTVSPRDIAVQEREHCGPQPTARCRAALNWVRVTEWMSLGASDIYRGYGLSHDQLETMFNIARKEIQ